MTDREQSPHFDVTAALICLDGKVLVTKRPKGAHLEGYWEFPGGKREAGETLASCVEREIDEELGLQVKAEERLLTVHHQYASKRISLHAFRCAVVGGTPDSIQCEALMWVSPDELEAEKFPPPDRQLIDVLFRGKGRIFYNPGGFAMFYKQTKEGYAAPAEGVRLKTLVHGEKTHMCEFRLKKGSLLPKHSHPHEQTGYLVSGRVDLFIEGKKLEALPGDGWCIPGDAEHWADSLEDSVVVEVFSPVRDDYLS